MFRDLFGKTYVHLILIASIGLIVYSNTFNVPFQWDEEKYIENNPIVKDLSYFLHPSKAKGIEQYGALKSRYIGYLTFALNYKLHGLDVRGYHVFNITIHILNAILVYFLVSLTFRTPFMQDSKLKKHSQYIALFTGLLFVSHPIQTEAVTYIFQRLASLAAFFYLLSLVLYIKWRIPPSPNPSHKGRGTNNNPKEENNNPLPRWEGIKGRVILYLISLLSAVLAMKTKENAFTLPIVVILYEFFFFKGVSKKRVFYLVPIFLTMLIIPLTLIGIDKPVGEILGEMENASRGYENMNRFDYLITQFRVVVTYIRLMFLPINQNIDYDYPIRPFFTEQAILSVAFMTSILGFSLYLLWHSRYFPAMRFIAFGIFWFFITLSVESSIIPLPMVINEYRMYLPSTGVFLFLTNGVFILTERLRKWHLQTAVVVLLVLVTIVFSYATFRRNAVWISKVDLWEDVARKSPRKVSVYNNLGNAYMSQGLLDKAIASYQVALKIKPAYTEALNNIGKALWSKGMTDKSIEFLKAALMLEPGNASVHYNLGIAFMSKGLTDKAIDQYQLALALKPDLADAYYSLAVAYLKKGLINLARRNLEATLNINPDFPNARALMHNIENN